MILNSLYKFFNYLDTTLAYEKVATRGFDKLKINSFTTALRAFEIVIEYILGYAIIKFFQFVLSLLLKTSMQELELIYFLVPLLMIFEIGASKKDFLKGIVFLQFLIRVCVKTTLFYGIDLLLYSLFD